VLNVLASGVLVAQPQRRTAAAGKDYATCTMRTATDGADAVLCSLIAFAPDAVDALVALGKGDALAIAGRAKLSNWIGKDGNEAHGLSVVADKVLTVYAAAKTRKAARDSEVPA
jgi:single-stranded DNA-binding protein